MLQIKNGDLFSYLKERGYVYQITHEDAIKKALNEEKVTFYLGIDPTADSLHIGHFFALMMFRHLQEAGHKGIVLIGGATAMVGDPSGKSDMRKMITKETVEKNLEEVKTLVRRFVRTDGENAAIIVNNGDWINPYDYISFMRDVGIHFNVNKMLSADAYAKRMEAGGLTFLEMGYMLMQAYDFVHLNKEFGCTLQIGGSDQWGNIVAGIDLGRRMKFAEEGETEEDNEMFGLTCPLLMTKDGKKMGKTESGALWVAREKTTTFDFYQYFYNVGDDDVESLLKLFTFKPTDEIEHLCTTDIIKAKRTMAYEVTKLVHGEEAADEVIKAVETLYSDKVDYDNVPSIDLEKSLLELGINVLDLLVLTDLFSSKGEARRMVQQNGVSINGHKVTIEDTLTLADLEDGFIIVQKGKKKFLKLNFI